MSRQMYSRLDKADREAALDAILYRTGVTLDAMDEEFPYFADPGSGEWTTTQDGNWCGGHWIGLLWLAYARAESDASRERYSRAARNLTDIVVENVTPTSMFRGMNLHYAGFRAYDITGDRSLFALGLTGADDMVEFYDGAARQIPLGTLQIQGPDNFRGKGTEDDPSGAEIGAVDSIYTALPVLWRAYRETHDPRFRDVAVSHADRHLDWYINDDGSTWHHAVFNPKTGTLRRQYNELAFSNRSCWARGQGWNIAGLARAYNETGAERYLQALELTTDYYIDNSPEDLVAHWDLEEPAIPDAHRDTSAAALAAYGLTRISGQSAHVVDLRKTGEQILSSLVKSYLVTDDDDDRRGMVCHGCYNAPGRYATDNELLWTDYYVAQTLYDSL